MLRYRPKRISGTQYSINTSASATVRRDTSCVPDPGTAIFASIVRGVFERFHIETSEVLYLNPYILSISV
jgi:hypothetical protein